MGITRGVLGWVFWGLKQKVIAWLDGKPYQCPPCKWFRSRKINQTRIIFSQNQRAFGQFNIVTSYKPMSMNWTPTYQACRHDFGAVNSSGIRSSENDDGTIGLVDNSWCKRGVSVDVGEKGGDCDGDDENKYCWQPGPVLTGRGDGGVGGEEEGEAKSIMISTPLTTRIWINC